MFEALTQLIQRTDPTIFFAMMIPILGVVGGSLIAIVRMAISHMQYVRDAELKRDMIAHGMSADEIERVLTAKSGENHEELAKLD